MVQLRWGLVSITGNYRDNNEDCCLVDDKGRYFLVADGMGGQAAGEKASKLAVEIISKSLERGVNFEKDSSAKVTSAIDDAVSRANLEIIALGKIDPASHNMGTTIAFLISAAGKLFVGGVGDSRAYLLRDGVLEQLTTDHSLTQALIEAGTITAEEAVNHRYRNVLYRYLGTKEGGTGTEPEEIEPQSGDRLLLCSDGVTDGLDEDPLCDLLCKQNDPQAAAKAVVDAAQAGGSKDNISALVVHVE